eukprot:gene19655-6829_t
MDIIPQAGLRSDLSIHIQVVGLNGDSNLADNTYSIHIPVFFSNLEGWAINIPPTTSSASEEPVLYAGREFGVMLNVTTREGELTTLDVHTVCEIRGVMNVKPLIGRKKDKDVVYWPRDLNPLCIVLEHGIFFKFKCKAPTEHHALKPYESFLQPVHLELYPEAAGDPYFRCQVAS